MTDTTELPRPKWADALTTPKQDSLPKSIYIHGLPGSRKTSTAASIALVPEVGKKVLLIDVDFGAEVLAQNPLYSDIEILQIDPLEEGERGAFFKLNAVINDITTTDYGYTAVILDPLSIAQDIAEKHFKALYATAGKGGNPDGFKIWGELGVWTDEIVRKLHTCPFFTAIITSHSTETKAESGAHRILPKLSGSSKEAIASIPSIVMHLGFENHPSTGERHSMATLGDDDVIQSKNRYGLRPKIIDLDMPKLYALINERVGEPAPAQTTKKED